MLGLCEALGASALYPRVHRPYCVGHALAMRGPIGHGTVIHALGAGPLIQFFLVLERAHGDGQAGGKPFPPWPASTVEIGEVRAG